MTAPVVDLDAIRTVVPDPQHAGGSIEFGPGDAKGGSYWRVVRSSVGRKCDRAHLALLADRAALLALAERQAAALREFGRHTDTRCSGYAPSGGPRPCFCGLTDTLAALASEAPDANR